MSDHAHLYRWVGGEYACVRCHPEKLAPCPICHQIPTGNQHAHYADEIGRGVAAT